MICVGLALVAAATGRLLPEPTAVERNAYPANTLEGERGFAPLLEPPRLDVGTTESGLAPAAPGPAADGGRYSAVDRTRGSQSGIGVTADAPIRIVIPAIQLDAPVVPTGRTRTVIDGQEFTQWVAPSLYAVGWHNDSAALGQSGNTVLNGHHNAFGEVFRHLNDLRPGDEILLYSSGVMRTYQVDQLFILEERSQPLEVRLRNAQWIQRTADERVTLLTCWPYSSNSHRLVVVANPVPTAEPPEDIGVWEARLR